MKPNSVEASEVGRRDSFVLRFLVFVGIGAALNAALTPAWPHVTRGYALLVAQVASLMGLRAVVGKGAVMFFGGGSFSYSIIAECTAISLCVVFAAAILSYPATRHQRLLGLFIGLPLLLMLNVARLITLAWIGVHAPARFEFFHIYGWQAFMIVSVGLGWFAWARYVVHLGRLSRGGSALPEELPKAVAIFVCASTMLGILGALGGVNTFRMFFQPAAYSIVEVISGRRVVSRLGNVWPYFQWSYATCSALVALFLATPRVRWKRKARGLFVVAAPVAFGNELLHFVIVFYFGGAAGLGGSFVTPLLFASRIAVGISSWYLWARPHWMRAFVGRDAYRCPLCGVARDDLLSHVRTIHKRRRTLVEREVLKEFPELRRVRS